jgi:hypothetical protein
MRILFILCALLLGACAPSTTSQANPPRDESTSPNASVRDAEACSNRGGTWRRVCLMGTWSCVMPYRDAGKACSDKKECEGQCRYQGSEQLAPGSPAKGVCQRDSDPCGCFAEVRDGKLQHALCVD